MMNYAQFCSIYFTQSGLKLRRNRRKKIGEMSSHTQSMGIGHEIFYSTILIDYKKIIIQISFHGIRYLIKLL